MSRHPDDQPLDDEVLDDSPVEREILLQLANLPHDAAPARDLWPAIAHRIGEPRAEVKPSSWIRFLAYAAAALLLFASGVAVGHRWSGTAALSKPAHHPVAAAAAVHRTGTALAARREVALADDAESGRGGRCPDGHPETGDLGIESLLCVSGSCRVNLRTDRGYVHDFSTEPRIRGLAPGGPAAGRLQNGDILIAVDGVLITSREGGRRLANLKPGVPVTLRVRRDGRETDVVVVPRLGCNMPRLIVLAGGKTTILPF